MTIISKLSDGRFAAHNSYHGPFGIAGSTKYAPLLSADLRKLVMAKATLSSPGDNDWSQAGPEVSVSGTADVVCLYAFHDSGNGRIGVGTAQANGAFRYHAFDTASETWDITDELIVQPVAATGYTAAEGLPSLALSWRANGDVTCVHNGNNGSNNGLYRAIRTSSWGSFTRVQGSNAAVGAIVSVRDGPTDGGGNDERTNFLYQRGSGDLRRWHYNSGVSVDNETVATDLAAADILAGPGAMDDGDIVYFPYVSDDDKIHVLSWDGTDDATTVGASDSGAVSGLDAAHSAAATAPFPPMGLVFDGTDLHLVYAAAGDGDIYHNDNAAAPGGTETKVVSGITCHHLSVGLSADGGSLLLLYGDGNRVARFARVAIGGGVPAANHPLCAFLVGLRKLPVPPDPPPPDSRTRLPEVAGETLWEQLWGGCVLAPHSLSGGAAWDVGTRGAVGFEATSDELCRAPGRLRLGTWPSGTFRTRYDSELAGNVLEVAATRQQYQTRDQLDKNRNHTEIELHRDGTPRDPSASYDTYAWSRKGRGWPPMTNYKLSFLTKLGSDFGKDAGGRFNEQWCIIGQCFGLGDSDDGSRNPWMPITVVSGAWQITLRGDSRSPLYGDKNYEYPNQAKAPKSFSLGPVKTDVWECFEISFRYDHRKRGDPGEGYAFCKVKRNGEVKLDISGIQLGYNDKDGSFFSTGLYHDFNGTSNATSLTRRIGPLRFEKLS